MKYLKSFGYKCWIVEKFNPYAIRGTGRGKRSDMFGIIDIIALTFEGVLGVQSTGTDFSGHHKKLTLEKRQDCIDWLNTPGTRLQLIGWRKLKEGNRMLWKPRVKEYTLSDFVDVFEGV